MNLQPADLAWLAGIIDGEGCINLHLPDRDAYMGFVVRVGMTHEDTVRRVEYMAKQICGDAVRVKEEFSNPSRTRPIWNCEIYNRKAIEDLLTTIRPFMVTKAIEADLLLAYLDRWNGCRADDREAKLARVAQRIRKEGSQEAYLEALGLLSSERYQPPQVTPTRETTLAWLAGLIDGEGCIFLQVRSDKMVVRRNARGERVVLGPYHLVRNDLRVCMTHPETIIEVGYLFGEICGDPDVATVNKEHRKTPRQRPLWNCTVHSQAPICTILEALRPYLFTKSVEADLLLRYAEVRQSRGRLVADRDDQSVKDYELALARAATRIRKEGSKESYLEAKGLLSLAPNHGCREAPAEPNGLREVILSETSEGIGSEGRATTTDLSPNNNNRHERPAPDLEKN